MLKLAAFSYSLYLSHYPVESLVYWDSWRLRMTPIEALVAQFLVVVPASVLVTYIFHLLFERPMLCKRQRVVLATKSAVGIGDQMPAIRVGVSAGQDI
jgi:peptidoglycan/LPS O-acetylase OafA/YrhL